MHININNIALNYKVSGCGPELILLHGWGMNLETFDNLCRELSEDFTVYQIDLPGFGLSDIPYAFTIDDYVEIINKFINELKIINPVILGHSFGGRIAIKYASIYDVDKLILVSTPGIKEKFSIKKYIKIKIYKFFKKLKFNFNMGSNDYRNANSILKKVLVMAVNYDLTESLLKINVPTLLIYGQKDKTVPLYIGKKLNQLIKGSGLVVVPNCSHFPYVEKFRYFIIVLKYFLLSDNK